MPYTVPKLTDFSPRRSKAQCANSVCARSGIGCSRHPTSDWKAFRDRWMARKNGVLTQVNDLWLKAPRKKQARRRPARQRSSRSKVEQAVRSNPRSPSERRIPLGNDLQQNALDITLPGIRRPLGAEHPVIKTMNEIVGVFRNLGYSVEEGPGD